MPENRGPTNALANIIGLLAPYSSSARIFAETVLGVRQPITEQSLFDFELEALRKAAKRAQAAGRGSIQYEDYPHNADPVLMKDVTWENLFPSLGASIGSRGAKDVIGRSIFSLDERGNTVLSDTYDFNKNVSSLHALIPEGQGRPVRVNLGKLDE